MIKIVFIVLAAMSFFPWKIHAETPEEKGLAIAMEGEKRNSGFGNYRVDAVMTLRNRQGAESRREMRTHVIETEQDGDKSFTIFDAPADVRGTALLTHTHKDRDDDQWLYLPALKRVKRISAGNKSGSFMGSEFTYEDLGSREVEKYSYRYLRDEKLDGKNCFVVELYPKDQENSGYSRIVSWIDTSEYIVYKEEYYDEKKRLLKTLACLDYQKYLGYLWRPQRLEMVNQLNGKETDLERSNFKFRTGLSDRDFTKNSLKRSK